MLLVSLLFRTLMFSDSASYAPIVEYEIPKED